MYIRSPAHRCSIGWLTGWLNGSLAHRPTDRPALSYRRRTLLRGCADKARVCKCNYCRALHGDNSIADKHARIHTHRSTYTFAQWVGSADRCRRAVRSTRARRTAAIRLIVIGPDPGDNCIIQCVCVCTMSSEHTCPHTVSASGSATTDRFAMSRARVTSVVLQCEPRVNHRWMVGFAASHLSGAGPGRGRVYI